MPVNDRIYFKNLSIAGEVLNKIIENPQWILGLGVKTDADFAEIWRKPKDHIEEFKKLKMSCVSAII